jgi:hypothetical protein
MTDSDKSFCYFYQEHFKIKRWYAPMKDLNLFVEALRDSDKVSSLGLGWIELDNGKLYTIREAIEEF